MASMKDIKQRISNIYSTEQLIKAMDMIASTKLHKARAQLEGVRPIYNELGRITKEIGSLENAREHWAYRKKEVQNTLYLIITSDRGFAGAYNTNITAKALHHMKGKSEKIIVIGSKGYDFYKRSDKNIIWKITDVSDAHIYQETEAISKWVLANYLSGEAEEVYIAYTDFENVLSYVPVIDRLLPLPVTEVRGDMDFRKFEPNLNSYIEHVVPLYLHMSIFRAFSESHASEQAARMVSMDAASKNAAEMIDKLTYMYNRRRQAAITQELSEIVGGTNLL